MDTEPLEAAFAYVRSTTKNGGLLVVRNGWLLFERYFGRGHHEAAPNLGSCGKSFTSIAIGILLAQQPQLFPDGLDQKVYTPRYLPAAAFPLDDPAKGDIKLGQLLAFTAGIRGNNPVHVRGKPETITPAGPDGWPSVVDEIALGKEEGEDNGRAYSTKTLWCPPGGGYSYATSSIHLASVILRHTTGLELEAFLRTHLGEPLGFSRWGFGYKHTRARAHTPGGGGVALRGTDMLRFGYLLLHEGRWAGRQVVPAEYVRHCGRTSPYNPHYAYSLQFNVNTDGNFPALPRDTFWKNGSGGHSLLIVPSQALVVFKLGGRDEQYEAANTGIEPPLPAKPDAPGAKEVPDTDGERALRSIETLRLVLRAIRA